MRPFLLTWLAVLAGCNAGVSRPEVYPVTGVVSLDGVPVADADVAFIARDSGGKSARGRTDAEGMFHLKTYFGPQDDADGAVAGDYLISVRKLAELVAGVDADKQPLPKNQLPQRYSDPARSGLTFAVKTDGPNTLRLNLTKSFGGNR